MNLHELLLEIRTKAIFLRRSGDELVLRGDGEVLDPRFVEQVKSHKSALFALIGDSADPWWAPMPFINPEMVPLAELNQEEIDEIVRGVPGGAENIQDIYGLAPLQEGILFHHLMGGEGDPYLLASQLSFEKREQLESYLKALQGVVDRHDILRTGVVWEGLREPVQVVQRKVEVPVEEIDLGEGGDAAEEMYRRFDPRHHRIDVRRAPMLRVYTAEDKKDGRWLLVLLLHHLAGDHTTLDVMQAEMQAYLLGKSEELATPQPFRNLIAEARLGVSREEHEGFFRKMLGGVDEPTLPFGLVDVQGDGTGIEEGRVVVEAGLARRLRTQARKLGVSAASVCHLAWARVLAEVSGREDVVFGTVLFGRMQGGESAERGMGMFINTLPVRIEIKGERVEAGVRRTQRMLAELLRHEHASLALAQRCSGVRAPMPLFSSLLNYRHIGVVTRRAPTEAKEAWEGVRWLRGEERTNYPLTLSVDDLGEGFSLTARAPARIGPKRVCGYMERTLGSLVEALEKEPEKEVERLEVIPCEEREQLLYGWNRTEAEYPREKCIHELFEEQVEKSPEAVAVVYEGEELSYGELNRRANRLGHYLRRLGVKADERVGICVERSLEMVVGLMGILKAGGAYVPLDPAYPEERLRYMLEDSEPVVLVTQRHLRGIFEGHNGKVVEIEGEEEWKGEVEENPKAEEVGLRSEHLAYIIYTSGSTGRPKGVAVEHRSVANLIFWNRNAFELKPGHRSSAVAGFGFDAAAWETWPVLCVGAVLVVAQNTHDTGKLLGWWEKQKLNVSFLPTPIAEVAFAQELGNFQLQTLLVGGDRLRRLPQHTTPFNVINNYGPTETTVVATSGRLDVADRVFSIGRPIANTRIYILDSRGEPVPAGVAGEIHIGGAGVARGYWKREELTAEKFIPDPFARESGARMYRTGDVGRWQEDGNIEFLGRNDDQVKIRGFRIELGEIEARLREYEGIREAVVVAREEGGGEKRLVAYYTGEERARVEELRGHLQSQLPEYMVPAAYVKLDEMPLTANGKLNRRALPEPEGDAYAVQEYEEPRGEIEKRVAEIWAEVLRVERVGRRDNFFELGGHSLLAVTLVDRMRRAGLRVDVRTLFMKPTLGELVEAAGDEGKRIEIPANGIPEGCRKIRAEMVSLAELNQEEIDEIVRGVPGGAENIQDIYGLAPLQEGILFHHLMGGEGDPYLLASQLSFEKREQLESYLKALQGVVDRHDILRTGVVWEGLREPVQVVQRKVEVPVEEIDLGEGGDAAEEMYRRFDPRHHRIDVRRAPMLRVYTAEDKKDGRWLLVLLLHHLAGDHTTLDVMQAEMQAYLLGKSEELATPQPFRNLIAEARLGVSREEHEGFFRKMLGGVDEPTLPFGLVDVQGDGTGIEEGRVVVEAGLARRLRTQARKLGVSAASVCHLAWARVLAEVSGREDVVFGTVLFGRMQGGESAERGMGMFINTLPVRIEIKGERVEAGVRRTQRMLAELLRHEHASLALAQRCSGVRAPMPLFSSLLNYRHIGVVTRRAPTEAKEAWEGVRWLRGEERTNYPLTLSVDDLGEGFSLTARAPARIGPKRVCGYMERTLGSLVEALEKEPEKEVERLEVIPCEEREQLLYGWNRTEAEYPREKCIHELFEEQVEKSPEAVAVVYEGEELSYGELNRRANRLGHYLRRLGVKADERVGICVERSLEMVVGLMGILKAGGAYVPLDPAYPEERLRYMLEDSEPVVLVTQRHLRGIFEGHNGKVVEIEGEEEWKGEVEENPKAEEVGLRSEHLAYIIYTSGSTGRPKGVAVEHRNLLNYVYGTDRFLPFRKNPDSIVCSPISFDLTNTSFYPPLIRGGCITLIGSSRNTDIYQIAEELDNEPNRLVKMTPSHLRALIGVCRGSVSGRPIIVSGGEPLARGVVEEWRGLFPQTLVINHYGPTETTVGACTYVLPLSNGSDTIPIGRPIANTRIYILDSRGEPVPAGVAGEIHIGGAGVARGYWKREELTAEKFIPDPFARESGARMYRTGDVGRWQEDGNIEFLGRNDDQVKIRGFRIELGEIEARLREYEGIREAVVVAREEGGGEKRLVAYYTGEERARVEELRGHLQSQLPEYMVPAAYVKLDEMPLTANGKLNRRALPEPEGDAYAVQEYEEPRGEIEKRVAEIWAEVLRVERVGRRDNFFELGGHSLLAVTLVDRMRRAGLRVDVRTLFMKPTLGELVEAAGDEGKRIEIPANGIPEGCRKIRAEMVPLAELSQEEIDEIVRGVPGGAENIQDIYGLAPLQEGILFHHLMGGEGDPYLQVLLMSFEKREQLESYLKALQGVVDRHDILRTGVVWEGLREPVQVVQRKVEVPVEEIDLGEGGDAAEEMYRRFDPRHHRIDVRRAPMLRVYTAEDKKDGRWLLVLLRHHLAGDHTTQDVMLEEMQAYLLGKSEELATPQPFRNLIAEARLGVSREEHEGFFRKMLGGVDEPTLPFGLVDVQGDGTGIEEGRVVVEAGLARRLQTQARKLGVSAASVCHLAWARVLAEVSGREDVVFGTVLFGRMQGGESAERGMGMFINTLPVRIEIKGERVEAGVRRTQRMLAELLRHEHASLALAQRCSGVRAPMPLFSSLLNYRHIGVVTRRAPTEAKEAWEGVRWLRGEERTNYPLTLSVDDLGEGFSLTAQAPARIGPKRVCGYMERTLGSLVEALEKEPEKEVERLEVIPYEEREQLLYGWNRTEAEYPREKCIHELFEEQVEKSPEAVAVVYEGEELSYGELNRRANRLGHYLRRLGVKADERVGICVERSLEMVVGLMGILKAGGAYVPLDPAYPEERLRYMLEDSEPVVLVTQRHLRGIFEGHNGKVVEIEGEEEWKGEVEENPKAEEVGLRSEHLAYIIYTSGSTGHPKGVAVEHANIGRLFSATEAWFQFDAKDVWTLFHSYAFDFSVWEIWGALLYGGRLIVVPQSTAYSPEDFYRLLCRERVTILNQTPSAFQQLITAQGRSEESHQLRHVIFGGEALEIGTLSPWYRQNQGGKVRMVNMYGITETTVHVTYRLLEERDVEYVGRSPIGRRIPDLRIYILDSRGEPVPAGVAGEIHIGGAGVARGYWKREELTAEKFIPDPFARESGARMYRTGDVGRWQEDGNIEFLGRNDDQVKIRGFRIELGEIEARLREYEGIREAVVVAREEGGGEKRLVAYYTGEERARVEELRGHLQSQLPEYMVPAAYVKLDEMPLTANGKLNRRALPEPEGDAYAVQEYEEPRGEIEKRVAEIWAEVLRVERVGRRDNFFELGGHSLLAMRTVASLRQVLDLDIGITDLFERPRLFDFAHNLGATPNRLPIQARHLVGERGLPLSYAQRRLWFINHLNNLQGTEYNLSKALRLRGKLDINALTNTLTVLVQRHETLRTHFVEIDGEPTQIIDPIGRIKLLEQDLSHLSEEDRLIRLSEIATNESRKPFDLASGPLLRMKLLRLADQDHVLLRTMHHIITDGWSEGVFNFEFGVLYEASRKGERASLKPLPVQYSDFALSQQLTDGELETGLRYWKTQLNGMPKQLELPTDRPRPDVQTFEAQKCRSRLPDTLTKKLKELCIDNQLTLYMAVLAALSVLLARYSGQDDIVVGSPIANRFEPNHESLIGFFVNSLVMRVRVGRKDSFRDLLTQVRKVSLDAYRHQNIPFERIVEELSPERDLSKTPLFQVSLAMQNAPWTAPQMGDLKIDPISIEEPQVRFDLEVHAWEEAGRLEFVWLYSRKLFDCWRMQQMSDHLIRVLEAMVTDPNQVADEAQLSTCEEREQLLYGWNQTEAEYPREKCIHELFEEQVEKSPEAVAVVYEGEELSYGELNRRANRLGHYLRRLGVKADERVGICVERSLEMVVGLMGILKAGGAYVPLDPAYPEERLRYMLEDSEPVVLVTQRHLRGIFEGHNGKVVEIEGEEEWKGEVEENPKAEEVGLRSEHLAYIIYTSGSTGRPKGVAVEHRNLTNYLSWVLKAYAPENGAVVSSSLSFDATITSLYGPLVCGGATELLPEGEETSGLVVGIKNNSSSYGLVKITPSHLDAISIPISSEPNHGIAKIFVIGGETLRNSTVQNWHKISCDVRLVNEYGPTETTVGATTYEVPLDYHSSSIPIGRPIANTRIYILDSRGEPVPAGVAGEIHIGGAGVARGYWKREELTAEKFIPDPFARESGARMYRTGDVGRWQEDGNIEFLGRNDDQVKIRGFRIELGEIEARLREYEGIREAVVVAREEGGGEKRLVAYVIHEENESERSKLRISHVRAWQDLYESSYGRSEYAADDFDLTGWDSSYTGEPIPTSEMREWVKETVIRLRDLHPKRVLEIGCGTGLILTRLAAACESYVASDFSARVLQRLKSYLQTRKDLSHVLLRHWMAHDLASVQSGSVDLVILNSVVQYFPDINYLFQVLREAIRVTRKGGHIFVGDVRSLSLLSAYHTSVQIHKAIDETPIADVRVRVLQALQNEKELVLEPDVFDQIGEHWEGVSRIEKFPKSGCYDNELSRFRYDVVMSMGERVRRAGVDQWVDWDEAGCWKKIVAELLRRDLSVTVGVRGIRDKRSANSLELARLLDGDGSFENLSQLKVACAQKSGEDLGDVVRLANDLGVEMCWQKIASENGHEVAFRHRWELVKNDCRLEVDAYRSFANEPVRSVGEGNLERTLREFLRQKLPEYMVPAAYVKLDEMPLTANGKLDRRALPEPEGDAYAVQEYEEPRGEIEKRVAEIWAEVLRVERVGRRDNFFELGGHSLLAVMLVDRMRRAGLRVDVRTLFMKPTLGELVEAAGDEGKRIEIPANGIPEGCRKIRAEMVPLAELSQEEIDEIVRGVPGGAENIQDIYGLAPLQEGILFHHLMGGEGDPYLQVLLMSFEKREQLESYLKALQGVVDRHDILRTGVVWEGLREPVQVVQRKVEVPVEEIDLGEGGDAAEEMYRRFDPRHHRIDVRRAPMLRVYTAEDKKDGRWLLVLLLHHLAGDHTTQDVMLEEMQAYLLGKSEELATPQPFRNLIAEARLGVSREEHEGFFRKMLGGVDEPTLPFGLVDVQGDGTGIEEGRVVVEAGLARRLRTQARKLGVSAASVCHLAWARVLAEVSGREDVVFGTVLFGRMQGGESAERGMGMFINTLPVRIEIKGERVEAGVRRTQRMLAELLRHEHASLALAQRCSGVRAPMPLFSSLLNYRHSGRGRINPTNETVQAWQGIKILQVGHNTNYPLTLSVDDLGEGFSLTAQAPARIGPKRVCGYMERTLGSLVEALEKEPEKEVERLEVIPYEEREQLLYGWNRTEAEYPREKCIHELFEEQVEKSPEAVAVVYEGEELSYGELNRRANRLGHYLRRLGVKADERVGICVERSLEMVVGLMGILKAGGAYVPLDPAYPEERLRYMLEDSEPVVLVTQRHLRGIFEGHNGKVVEIEGEEEWKGEVEENPKAEEVGLRSEHLAYIIYTSGSTGRPKGVAVEHRNLLNYVYGTDRFLPFRKNPDSIVCSPISFDLTNTSFYPPLIRGGCITLIGSSRNTDIYQIAEELDNEPNRLVKMTPSHLRALIGVCRGSVSGRPIIVSGGEPLARGVVEEWRGLFPQTLVINHYGPTETTVGACTYVLPLSNGSDTIPIGRPIANTRIYILDSRGEPVPAGVAGEIHIGGAGVARGYWKREELTAEKFIPDPFARESGARMYRTGDVGRWQEDGNIEFLGRNDDQVKIRGFRIELGEIEARLREYEGIREAVVVAREEGGGEKRLVAYYTGEERARVEELRGHLQSQLPEYMVPAAYVKLDEMPLTANGKLNRRALPEPEGDAYAVQEYEEPRGEIEKRVAEIWAEVLRVERVGRRDNFFELGGHSLLAVRVISRIRQVLKVEIAISELFAHSSLSGFAKVLESAARSELSPIMPADRSRQLRLSFAQQRLWFLAQMEGVSEAYHIPFGMRLRGDLKSGVLRKVLDRIVERHEALRTTFVMRDGEAVQEIGRKEESHFHLVEQDLRGGEDVEGELRSLIEQEARAGFDLTTGPLIRGRLIRVGEQEHALLITMHHIVSDGWSRGILRTELNALYGAFARGEEDPLPELEVQYADYAAWQREWVEGKVLQEQGEYWKRTLEGAPGLLEVPGDYARPAQQEYEGGYVGLELDEELTQGLKELSRRHGATMFMTLLAGWGAFLGRLAGQEDVVIGTPVANRGRREIEGLIGFFVNTLAMRVRVEGGLTVGELVERVKKQVLGAQERQDIPFEQVVEILRPVRSLSHSPLFQVMFAWQNVPQSEVELSGLSLSGLGGPKHISAKFDLTLSLGEAGGKIVGGVEYAASIYRRSTVERYIGNFRRFLEGMVEDEGRRVDGVALLTCEEREQLLYGWNQTEAEYPREKCIHELFEEQVEKSPEAVAVVYEGEELSYGELNRRANRLGHYLRRLGVKADERVGICVERSLEMVVGLMGILKAGGAYVPLDPAYPEERLRYMLEDSEPVVLVTQRHLRGIFEGHNGKVVEIEGEEEWKGEVEENPKAEEVGLRSEHLAYIIYTSGSTGRPKGVMGTHEGMVNRLNWMWNELPFRDDERGCIKTSLNFLDSVSEIFGYILQGKSAVVIPQNVVNDVQLLVRHLEDSHVTRIVLVPSLLKAILDISADISKRLRKLTFWVSSGETLPRETARDFKRVFPTAHLLDFYGSSEVSADCTWHEITDRINDKIVIGRPIANTRIYILDSRGEPVPAGVAGEIHIGGAGVARGYWKREELTAEKFIPDPFARESGARMYRTGDVGRWQEDGNIEFLGRNDDQVKIRGFRIELGEIEARLREYEGIREAVVVAREEGGGEKRLVAYYTGEERVRVEELRGHLQSQLPEYMVPAAYVKLDEMPLTANGKLNRRALPEPEGDAYAVQEYEEPRGEIEKRVAEIWAEVLRVERVGRRDNFFELGGHSLLAVMLVNRIRSQLYVDIQVRDIFTANTIKDLAAILGSPKSSISPLRHLTEHEWEDRYL